MKPEDSSSSPKTYAGHRVDEHSRVVLRFISDVARRAHGAPAADAHRAESVEHESPRDDRGGRRRRGFRYERIRLVLVPDGERPRVLAAAGDGERARAIHDQRAARVHVDGRHVEHVRRGVGGAGSTRTDPPPRTERNPEPAGPPSTLKPPATRMDLSATETEGDTIHSVEEAAEREEDFFVGRKDGRDRSALAEPPWSRCASPVNATLSETSKWTTPPPPGASPPPPSPPRSPRANQPLEPAF